MSAEDNKDVVRKFYERVINGRDVSAIDELLTADFRHNGEPRGRDGQRVAVEAFLAGFSDLHNEIADPRRGGTRGGPPDLDRHPRR